MASVSQRATTQESGAERLSATDLLLDPQGTIRSLGHRIYGLLDATVVVQDPDFLVMELVLCPWEGPAAEGYPVERVRIAVWSSGRIEAVPLWTDSRPWLHRFPEEYSAIRQLCLWDPWDPPELRWDESDGLEAYVHIVHRHLQAEEYWRRTNRWPVEDAPHGEGPHPIRSVMMKTAAGMLVT